jgi:hypothetical protein
MEQYPTECMNDFGGLAAQVKAVEMVGGSGVLVFKEELPKALPEYLGNVFFGFQARSLAVPGVGSVPQPRISIPVASILHRDVAPLLNASEPIMVEMKTGPIVPEEMTLVQDLFTSVISMSYYNPDLDNFYSPRLTPNSARGGWDMIAQAPDQSDPCLDHWPGISCNEGTCVYSLFLTQF